MRDSDIYIQNIRINLNEDKAFKNCGTNTHFVTAKFHLKEWKEKIFDTEIMMFVSSTDNNLII